jgi:hypothetical protein
VVVRGPAEARQAVARQLLAQLVADAPDARLLPTPPASDWPFHHPLVPAAGAGETPGVVVVPDLHEAFVNAQTNATRLVTTQPLYLLALWTDYLDAHPGVRFLATIDADCARTHAPEALDGRGAWRQVASARGARTGVGRPAAGVPRRHAGRTADDRRPNARRRAHTRTSAGDGQRLHGSERPR